MKKLYLTSLEISFPNIENKVFKFQSMVVVTDDDLKHFIENAFGYSEKMGVSMNQSPQIETEHRVAFLKAVVHYKEKFKIHSPEKKDGCTIVSCVVEDLIDNQPIFEEHTTFYFDLMDGRLTLNEFFEAVKGNESFPPEDERIERKTMIACKPEELLNAFWNRSSNASPLETIAQEKEEAEWAKWIRNVKIYK